MSKTQNFSFIDLFAGIGGFHLAMKELGGHCVFASEIDSVAAKVYTRNHLAGHEEVMHGDIIKLTEPKLSDLVPQHDVLTGGFPCQPFSKGGLQQGVNEARGTLFFNIAKILEERKPKIFVLENVRNLTGPKHKDTWETIIRILRELGYSVSENPSILSPHLLERSMGGAPQVRERVYIVGVRTDLLPESARKVAETFYLSQRGLGQVPKWDAFSDVLDEQSQDSKTVSAERRLAIQIWSDFLSSVGDQSEKRSLPGFPIWEWALTDNADITAGMPTWKADFLNKNSQLYRENKETIDAWRARHPELANLANSYRKFEWQAGDRNKLDDTLIQFRPSGLRVKPATYFPALVAMNQTTFVPKLNRFITVQEAAKLQRFPREFDFGVQSDGDSFKQLGNAVCVGVVGYALTATLSGLGVSLEDIIGEKHATR